MFIGHVKRTARVFKAFFLRSRYIFDTVDTDFSHYDHALTLPDKSWNNLGDALLRAICIQKSRFARNVKLATIALTFTAKAHRLRFPRVDVANMR